MGELEVDAMSARVESDADDAPRRFQGQEPREESGVAHRRTVSGWRRGAEFIG